MWKKRLVRITGAMLSVALLLVAVFFALVYHGFFGPLPAAEELQHLTAPAATRVLDSRKRLIGRIYRYDRTPVSLEEVAPVLVQALVATEDKRFYQHRGIDWRSLLRVAVKSVLLQQKAAGGGSTLTLQLAKNLFPRQPYSFFYYPINKTREAITAYRLERLYSKEELLTLYLNTVSFGFDIYGVESAAQRYFGKPAVRLDTLEAATLVGMLKATTAYNPVLHPAAARRRRNVVLQRLQEAGVLDTATVRQLAARPLVLTYKPAPEQPAAYFMARVKKQATVLVQQYNRQHHTAYNLQTDGLVVHTTLNLTMQQHAEAALHSHMKQLQALFDKHWRDRQLWQRHASLLARELERAAKGRSAAELNTPRKMYAYTPDSAVTRLMSPVDSLKYYLKILQAGMVALAPRSGAVRVWVGGINYRFFPYDHVDYHARRQVGSTFKPIVYAAALENGVPPCHYYKTKQKTYRVEENVWRPANDDDAYEGRYSLTGALQHSVNTVSVKVLQDAGLENTIDLAHRLGIRADIPAVPSIALGTAAISPLEMATAYAAFVNGGYHIEPYTIEKITTSDGRVIYEHQSPEPQRVITERTAAMLTYMLQQVVEGGTGRAIRSRYGLRGAIGGKTGTTQNNADGWFVAITPGLVAATWVGGVYPQISFTDTRLGQGATMALPVFAGFYQRLTADPATAAITRERFTALPAKWQAELDCEPFKPGFRLKDIFKKDKKENQRPKKTVIRWPGKKKT